MKKIIFYHLSLLIPLMLLSCTEDDNRVFEINDVTVKQDGVDKPNVKSTIEFLSIAYVDLFETTLDNQALENLINSYDSFGDNKLIEDLVIRNFLAEPDVKIPTDSEMRADVEGFIIKMYKKFYNRNPNEFELWYMKNEIENDMEITTSLLYYAFMTSNEYRYY